MKKVKQVLKFDCLRCKYLFMLWLGVCLILGVSGTAAVFAPESFWQSISMWGLRVCYLVLAVITGVLFQACHPGHFHSFFKTKSIPPEQILWSRCLLAAGFLLFPFYLSQLMPLLFVELSWGSWSAFSLTFLLSHIAGILFCALFAAASRTFPTYMVRLLFGCLAWAMFGILFESVRWRREFLVRVPAKETVEIIRLAGMAGIAAILIWTFIKRMYRGKKFWPQGIWVVMTGILGGLLFALPQLRQDFRTTGHPIPPNRIDETNLTITAARGSHNDSFLTQYNKPRGHSTYGQTKPPYANAGEERFWFIEGMFKIENLKPEIGYSARLLEASWISPEGETLQYDPPKGTERITLKYNDLPPVGASENQINALLGIEDQKINKRYGTGIKLFGTWTSQYEKFKSTAGLLKIKVRVDFYTHSLSFRLPLNQLDVVARKNGRTRIHRLRSSREKLEIYFNRLSPKREWHVQVGSSWSNYYQHVLFQPKSQKWITSHGGSSGGRDLGWAIKGRFHKLTFESRFYEDDEIQNFSEVDGFELVELKSNYLGSRIVEVSVDDFALVTQRSLEAE